MGQFTDDCTFVRKYEISISYHPLRPQTCTYSLQMLTCSDCHR